MVLSDGTIEQEIAKGRMVSALFDLTCIQPASADIHLDKRPLDFKTWRCHFRVDVKENVGHIYSSCCNNLTPKPSDVADLPALLYYGMSLGQNSFPHLTFPRERLYGSDSLRSRHQGQ